MSATKQTLCSLGCTSMRLNGRIRLEPLPAVTKGVSRSLQGGRCRLQFFPDCLDLPCGLGIGLVGVAHGGQHPDGDGFDGLRVDADQADGFAHRAVASSSTKSPRA